MAAEEGDVAELLALMDQQDEDEKIERKEDEIGDSCDDRSEAGALEEEYLKLEAKMKEIQEKMKRKKGNSPKSSIESENHADTSPSSSGSPKNRTVVDKPLKPPEETKKSAFLAAFADASFSVPSFEKRAPQTTKVSMSQAQCSTDMGENEPPPQKKRRVCNSPTSDRISSAARGYIPTETIGNNSGKQCMASGRPALKKPLAVCKQPETVEIEYFSRIRMKKSFVSSDEMRQRMQGKKFLKLGFIRSTMQISKDTDWVTVGVIAKQLERQGAKNGKSFGIWNLTDLDDCTKTVTFFLFGVVYDKLVQNFAVGSVVGFLNPSIMPPKKDDSVNSFSDTPALTVDVAERVMHIGLAADLGWCVATKWRNKQPAGKCLSIVNKQISDVCVFHMKAKYNKTTARRSELQGSAAAPIAQKYKNTLWNKTKNDQFFYGGKLYSAAPSALSGKPTESKVKLTKFLSNHADLAAEGKKELLERSKVMKALSGIDGDHTLSGCSQTFQDMLASGDNIAGSRQFLNHLNNSRQKEENKKNAHVKPQTAAELLKERGKLMKLKKSTSSPQMHQPGPFSLVQPKNSVSSSPSSIPTTKYVSSKDIQKVTAGMVKAKQLALAKKIAPPKLGSLASKLGHDEIELEWAPPKISVERQLKADLAKKKAIAKLRSDCGKVLIPKNNPNRGVLQQIENVRKSDAVKSKILQKVAQNQKNLVKKCDKSDEKISPPKMSQFGSMSRGEFESILNYKSVYSREIESSEIEEHEKYFNPLIKKEMMEKKMSETYEIPSKTVTCAECKYTFWAAHDRCKELRHHLHWRDSKKKFFQCSKCKRRTTTWETYPSRPCSECGSEKLWHRTSMLKERDVKILDAEILLIRGQEHGKFLSSLK